MLSKHSHHWAIVPALSVLFSFPSAVSQEHLSLPSLPKLLGICVTHGSCSFLSFILHSFFIFGGTRFVLGALQSQSRHSTT
jgi:hypothetical protein